MRPALLLFTAALLATLVALAAACGGSSSETPWPAEPEPAVMAPPPNLQPLRATGKEDAGARERKE